MNEYNLFDFIKMMFTSSDDDFDKISNDVKTRHYFMVNRFMSIKYPLQAAMFTQMYTSPSAVIDSWRALAKQFNRVPGWIYTKTKSAIKQKAKYKANEEALNMYIKINEIGSRDYESAINLFEVDVVKTLKSLEKMIKTIDKT